MMAAPHENPFEIGSSFGGKQPPAEEAMKDTISLIKTINICLLAALIAALGCACAEGSTAAVDLLAVDHRLYELGYRDSACTGEMDAVALNALRNFQRANGLAVTAAADEATVALLMSDAALAQQDYIASLAAQQSQLAVLANGSYGDDVLRLQRALRQLEYFSGECDGAYGRATEEAVYRFQLANGLEPSGVADSAVYLRIYSGAAASWQTFLRESCASVGESGDHVRRIQLWLREKSLFRGACTGRYGDGTQQAVKRFQTANGLEPSGDVDMNTCTLLYSDVSARIRDVAALRRGESGESVAALLQRLDALGYAVGEDFGMQTELAVMQFQQANGLEVSGVADNLTQTRFNSPNVVSYAAAEAAVQADVLALDEDGCLQAARTASAQLGQQASLQDGFDFVRYVYLKCGYPLFAREQLQVERLESMDELRSGQVIFVTAEGREICGVALSDGALICADDSGYIVMRYLDMMDVEAVFAAGVAG